MTVSFFGHRTIPDGLQFVLKEVLIHLIENSCADVFYVGNQGDFDRMVRKTLKYLKLDYPHIRYSVVLAYMPIKNREFVDTDYTDTIFPEGLENVYPKYAISARNKWMIEQADVIVTYVTSRIGGAAQFKELAEKKGKYVINLSDLI